MFKQGNRCPWEKLIGALMLAAMTVFAVPVSHGAPGEFTWFRGADTQFPWSVYGTKGVPDLLNLPGARLDAASWTDDNGNLWLFGGEEITQYGPGAFSDLWKYDVGDSCWTWVDGPDYSSQPGDYGTMGVASASNLPGARQGATAWKGQDGDLWLFGGFGYGETRGGSRRYLNDLWRYDVSEEEWTWVEGSKVQDQPGTYVSQGISNPLNVPGARRHPVSWTDAAGDLWLLGGFGFGETGTLAPLNDLWKYDISEAEWTWVGGSKAGHQLGNYGTVKVPAASNFPGGRYASVSWTDANDNLWLFGGRGYGYFGPEGAYDSLNDLWTYNIGNGIWTWMGGARITNRNGIYGSQGVPNGLNMPGARYNCVSWTDAAGDVWLFGGAGKGAVTGGLLNDLWKYSTVNGEWTWVKGSTEPGQPGIYGTKGEAALTNIPGARYFSAAWTDSAGDFWLFGGNGYRTSSGSSLLNDLWKFDAEATPVTSVQDWMIYN